MSLKRNTKHVLSSSVFQAVLNFMSGIILTRIIGAEGRGVLFKLEATVGLMSFFTNLKAPLSITYFRANKRIGLEKLVGLSILVFLFSSILSVAYLVILFVFKKLEYVLPIGYTTSFFVLYFILIYFLIQSEHFTTAFLKGGRHFNLVFRSQITAAASRLVILGGALIITMSCGYIVSLQTGLAIHLVTVFLTALIAYVFYWKANEQNPRFSINLKTEALPFFKYSYVGAGALFLYFINRSLDIWIVDYYSGTIQLGFYAVAVSLSSLMLLVPSALSEILIPYIAEKSESDDGNFATLSRINFALLIVLFLFFFSTGNFFIPFFYGMIFTESVLSYQILLLGMLVHGIGVLFSAYNYGKARSKLNLFSNLIGVTVTIVLNLILVPIYGIVGAALASASSYFVSGVFIMYSVLIKSKESIMIYFIPQKDDLKRLKNLIYR